MQWKNTAQQKGMVSSISLPHLFETPTPQKNYTFVNLEPGIQRSRPQGFLPTFFRATFFCGVTPFYRSLLQKSFLQYAIDLRG